MEGESPTLIKWKTVEKKQNITKYHSINIIKTGRTWYAKNLKFYKKLTEKEVPVVFGGRWYTAKRDHQVKTSSSTIHNNDHYRGVFCYAKFIFFIISLFFSFTWLETIIHQILPVSILKNFIIDFYDKNKSQMQFKYLKEYLCGSFCFPYFFIMGWVERRGGGGNFIPPYWFSLNNSEMVKAVILAFCSIQQHFIRDICSKFGIPILPQSPDIVQNSEEGISDFWSISYKTKLI